MTIHSKRCGRCPLSDEPGFGYETISGVVLAKGETMEEAIALLLKQYRNLADLVSTPYRQQSA